MLSMFIVTSITFLPLSRAQFELQQDMPKCKVAAF